MVQGLPRSMLRPSLHLTLVASVSVAGLTLPAPAFALAPGLAVPVSLLAPNPEADALYEEGRKDFSQGLYKSAIEKFEVAYKRSKDPLILYNIGQSYKKLYEDDPQIEYLRKAHTALTDYVAAVEKDASLGADPEEIKPVLVELDAELRRRSPAPESEGPEDPEPKPRPREGEDPGKKLRLAGIGMLGGGGALLVVGGVMGGVFAAKGGRLSTELNGDGGLYQQQMAMNCAEMMQDGEAAGCAALRADISTTRSAGEKSNLASALSFGVVGGVGALLLIGGAISYSLGRKRSADWQSETTRVRVLPGFGGLILQGRF
jgi:hypothetical protein